MTLKDLESKQISELENTKLETSEIEELTDLLGNWEIDQDGTLTTNFELENFKDAVKLFNDIAELAEEQGHHPDILLHNYSFLMVSLYTHDVEGLTEKDFAFAAKVEKLLEGEE